LLTASAMLAQSGEVTRPPFEVYAQASALGSSDTNTHCGGGRLGATWTPLPVVGFTGDFGYYRSAGRNMVTFMAGPGLLTRERYRTTWFGHALFGGSSGTIGGVQPAKTGFATAWGGGVDFPVTDHLVFRPVEGEFMVVNGLGAARFSSGFAFRLGGK
jgi:hypothetical protein